MTDAKKILSLDDFLSMPEHLRGKRAQFIEGQIVQKALPGGRHGRLEFVIGAQLEGVFRRKAKDDGPGGWWLQTETSVLYPNVAEIHTHDLVGWRRERVPQEPLDYPVRERPDWVCEIAVSSMKKDSRELPKTLQIEEVPFYWLVDSANERLIVFQRIDGHLIQTHNLFREDGLQRIPPFDATELLMGRLFGDDPE